MKFRFCGDRDCPDWLLAEIVLLTKIVRASSPPRAPLGPRRTATPHSSSTAFRLTAPQTSVKMKQLATVVLKDLLGDAALDYPKVEKLTADAKLQARGAPEAAPLRTRGD